MGTRMNHSKMPYKYRYCRREVRESKNASMASQCEIDEGDEFCETALPTFEHYDFIDFEYSNDRAFRAEDTRVKHLEAFNHILDYQKFPDNMQMYLDKGFHQTPEPYPQPYPTPGVPFSNKYCINIEGNADGGNTTIPLHQQVVYARVRGVIGDARGSFSSTTNQWTVTMDCDDGAFLNSTSNNVVDWLCQTCPDGGDCTNSFEYKFTGRRWEDVMPKMGFFRLDPVDMDPTKNIYFYECFLRTACLGGRHDKYAGEYLVSGASMKDSLDFNRTRRPERFCSMDLMDKCLPGDETCELIPTQCHSCGPRCPPEEDEEADCITPSGTLEQFDAAIFDGRPYYFREDSGKKYEYKTAHNGRFVEGWMRRREATFSTMVGVIYPAFYPAEGSSYDKSQGVPIVADPSLSSCSNKLLSGCCIDDPEARLLAPHPFGARRGYLAGGDTFVPYSSLTPDELKEECKFDWLCDIDLATVSDPEMCNHEAGHSNNCSKSRTGRCRLCRACKKGYFPKGLAKCIRCPPLWLNIVMVIIAMGALGTMLVVFLKTALESITKEASRHAHVHLAQPIQKIMLNHMQLVSLASGFPLRWPDEILALLDVFGIMSNAGSMLFNPACSKSDGNTNTSTFFIKQTGLLMMPLIAAVGTTIFWLGYTLDRKYCYTSRARRKHIKRLRRKKKHARMVAEAHRESEILHGLTLLQEAIDKEEKKRKERKKKLTAVTKKIKKLESSKKSSSQKMLETLRDEFNSLNAGENSTPSEEIKQQSSSTIETAHKNATEDEHHDTSKWDELDKLAVAARHSHGKRFTMDHSHEDVLRHLAVTAKKTCLMLTRRNCS